MKCRFNKAWHGPCGKPVVEGFDFCIAHLLEMCWCGKQATKQCDFCGWLVCGYPTCDEHECRLVSGGTFHSHKGAEQYRKWKRG